MFGRRIVVALALTGLMAGAASAGPGDGMNVRFKRLEGQRVSGQLSIDYAISKKSWKRLENAGIKLRMNLYTRGKHAPRAYQYSMRLNNRRGSFTYPKLVQPRKHDTYEFELVGFNRDRHVEFVSLDDSKKSHRLRMKMRMGRLVQVTSSRPDEPLVQPPRPPARPPINRPPPIRPQPIVDPNWKVNTINACRKAYSFDSDRRKCQDRAFRLKPAWAADTVTICRAQVSFDSHLAKCMDAADGHAQHPGPVINACGGKFSNDLDECVKLTATFRSEPVPLIQACKSTNDFASKFKKCLVASSKLGRSGPGIVKACKGSRQSECIRKAAAR